MARLGGKKIVFLELAGMCLLAGFASMALLPTLIPQASDLMRACVGGLVLTTLCAPVIFWRTLPSLGTEQAPRGKRSRIAVGHKLVMLSLVFLIPDSAMLYMMVSSINGDTAFAEQELRGTAYLRPLARLRHLTAQRRMIEAQPIEAGGGDKVLVQEIARLNGEIDRQFVELDAVHLRLAEALKFTPSELAARDRSTCLPSALKRDWEAMLAAGTIESGRAAFQAFRDRTRGMITHVGDMSMLILDPDLDSYYLVDAVLEGIPTAHDLAVVVEGGLTTTARSAETAAVAALRVELLRDKGMGRVSSSVHTSVNEPNKYGGKPAGATELLTTSLQKYEDAADLLATRVLDAKRATAAGTLQAAIQADQAAMELWMTCASELDRLLQRKLDTFSARRRTSLGITALAALAASLLVTFIHRSINGPIVRQAAELAEARDAAEDANRVKSDFLANMSHEIRTPMTAILGYAEILDGQDAGALTPEARTQYVQSIKRSGEHLLTIINDILDLSKIEAGKMTVEHIPVDVRQILAEVDSLMRVKAIGKGITLSLTQLTAVPSAIMCDPVRLRQILVNLVGNAIKFTDTGGVTVTVAAEPGNTPGGVLRVDVTDSGIGMTAEQVDKLFRPFEQADTSTTRRFGGTGLGLTISKEMALRLGGGIYVSSVEGRGSTFSVRIAAEAAPGAVSMAAGPALEVARVVAEESTQVQASGLEGARIFLAEDGPDNQLLVSFHLRRAGAEVTIFQNGLEALNAMTEPADGRLIEPPPCDLLITDMQMPEMDGYTLASALRSRGWERPIVALTAHAMEGDAVKCVSSGCNGYVTKPLDRKRLLETCGRLLAESRSRQAAPRAVA